MNCKKEFTSDFFHQTFTNAFITKRFKARREQILYEKEKFLLPATQPQVEKIVKKKKFQEEISVLKKQIEELKARTKALQYELMKLDDDEDDEKKDKKTFVCACPVNECRGFLSNRYKCGICDIQACSECREIKKDDHKCDPNTVETIKELQKTTRSCPNCQTRIFKIEGCFSKNQPILMYNGTTKMSQDIDIGDELAGDDGKKRIVLHLTRGEDEMYEVRQNNGETYTVNSQHKLVLKYTGDRSITWFESLNSWKVSWFCRENFVNRTKQFKVDVDISKEQAFQNATDFVNTLSFSEEIEITIEDYVKIPNVIKNRLFGFKSSSEIIYSSQDVILDPYLLGVWLGDGTSTEPEFASDDYEIQSYIAEWCKKNDAELVHETGFKFRIRRRGQQNYKDKQKIAIGFKKDECVACKKTGKKYKICMEHNNEVENKEDVAEHHKRKTNPFIEKLKEYNLIGNKHIPKEYMLNDRSIRLKLLAGIIDTDGHVSNEGKRAMIVQTSPILSQQIIKLARSCGFLVNVRIIERKNEIIFNREKKDYKDQYHITISGEFFNDIPTILPRKKCISSKPNKDHYRTSIDVISIGKGDFYGWSVDQNKRFLLPDHTVVRNCDQMWCTQCNVAFCWRTGRVEKGIIHNPHYFDFLKKNGNAIPRNPHEVRCGGMPDMTFLFDIKGEFKHDIEYKHEKTNSKYAYVSELYRNVNHVREVVMRALPTATDNITNMDLRIDFLMKKIDEEQFKTKLQRREKDRNKKLEQRDILDTYCNITQDLFVHLSESKKDKKEVDKFIADEKEIRKYAFNAYEKLNNKYKSNISCPLPSWLL